MLKRMVSFRVTPEDWEAFHDFAGRQGIEPYRALRTMVEAWAGAERLTRMVEGGGSSLDAMAEFARLTQEIMTVFRLNGELVAAINLLAEKHGFRLDLEELWQRYGVPPKAGGSSSEQPPGQDRPGGM